MKKIFSRAKIESSSKKGIKIQKAVWVEACTSEYHSGVAFLQQKG